MLIASAEVDAASFYTRSRAADQALSRHHGTRTTNDTPHMPPAEHALCMQARDRNSVGSGD
jgi:hypothetical protein